MTTKLKSPTARAGRIMTRVSNKELHEILKNALTYVEGEGSRGKLGKWVREAALNYKPDKKIKRVVK